jgi:hypothetical protein
MRMKFRMLAPRSNSLNLVVAISFATNLGTAVADSLFCKALIPPPPPGCYELARMRLTSAPSPAPGTVPYIEEVGVYNNPCPAHHETGGPGNAQPKMMPGLVNNALGHGYWLNQARYFGEKSSVTFHFDLFELQGFIVADTPTRKSRDVLVRIVKTDLFDSITATTAIPQDDIVFEESTPFTFVNNGFGTYWQQSIPVTTSTSRNWVLVVGQRGQRGGSTWNINSAVCRLPIEDASRLIVIR